MTLDHSAVAELMEAFPIDRGDRSCPRVGPVGDARVDRGRRRRGDRRPPPYEVRRR